MERIKPATDAIDLRRGIDHIGVTVCFVVHDGKRRVLLQKRSKNTRDEQGRWDIGGGALEFGERIIDAVRREIMEELCVEPRKIQFLESGEAHRETNGNKTHWIYLLHAAEVDPEKVKIGEPHKIDEIAWFTADSFPSPLHSMFEKVIVPAKSAGIV